MLCYSKLKNMMIIKNDSSSNTVMYTKYVHIKYLYPFFNFIGADMNID